MDDYFFVLKHGKHQFDLVTSEHHQMYKKGEWYGFYQLWMDWKGYRWMLPYICKWHDNIPSWITDETDEIKFDLSD